MVDNKRERILGLSKEIGNRQMTCADIIIFCMETGYTIREFAEALIAEPNILMETLQGG